MSLMEKIAKYKTDLDELERVEHFDPSPPGAIPRAKVVARRLKNMKEPKHRTDKERIKGQAQVGGFLGVPTGTLVGVLTESSHPLSSARIIKKLRGPKYISKSKRFGTGGLTAKKSGSNIK